MRKALKENRIIVFILVVLMLEAILFSVGEYKLEQKVILEERKKEELRKNLTSIPIIAKAVSIKNLTTGEKIYGMNDETPLPLASLVKTMTVLVALEKYKPNDIILLTEEAIKQNGDFGLYTNEKWKVGDLIKLTLISSANDGAFMLSLDDENFINEMNAKAKRIGMKNTYFINTTGLDLDEGKIGLSPQAGAFGSADDMNTLANFAILSYPEIFQATNLKEVEFRSESGFIHKAINTNTIVEKIPNLIFSKTGFTELTGGNLNIVFKNITGESIAVSILGSTIDGRFSDMEKIVKVIYNS